MNSFRIASYTLAIFATFAFACGGTPNQPVELNTDKDVQAIMGGVTAESAKLDAVGSLAFVYNSYSDAGVVGSSDAGGHEPKASSTNMPYPSSVNPSSVHPFCTATLIGPQTIVTAKRCLESVYSTNNLYFVVGSNTSSPKRIVQVIDIQFPTISNFLVHPAYPAPDLAIAHLDENLPGVTPYGFAELSEQMVNRRLVAVGYGIKDNNWSTGSRRLGGITVKALQGKVYEHMFKSETAFAEFANKNYYMPYAMPKYSNAMGNNSYSYSPWDDMVKPMMGGASKEAMPNLMYIADSGFIRFDEDAAMDSRTDAVMDASPDDTIPQDSGFDGPNPWNPSPSEIYNNTLLENSEVYVGGESQDVQPCQGDSGGPLLGKAADGTVRVFGVGSWTHRSDKNACDRGAVYARFTPSTLAWLEDASNWMDPCDGVASQGTCVGNTVKRCTKSTESARRLTSTNCSEIGLTCGWGSEGATCVEEMANKGI